MTVGWERERVSDIASHSLGKMLDKAKNKGEPRKYLRNLNVRWFEFDLSDLLEMRFLPEEEARYTVMKGDVVICEGGYPGRAAIWDQDEPIHFQKALHRVRFSEPERARWFLYYLQMKDMDGSLKSHFNGAGIQHFTGEALAKFELPLPPLPEQRRIVAILDEAFAGIATAKANAAKNLRDVQELFDLLLSAALDNAHWPVRRLDTLYKVGSSKRVLKSEWKSEGVPFYRGREITRLAANGFVENELCLTEKHYAELAAKTGVPGAGDIVITAIGTIGNAHIVRPEDRFYFKDASVVWMRRTAEVSSEFVKFWIGSSLFQDQLDKGNGATVDTLTIGKLQGMGVRLPPLAEQERVVEMISSAESETQRLESICTRKLAALDELKKSLLHQAFSGQL